MAHKTKEQRIEEAGERLAARLCKELKYLSEPKYYKNNRWSMAHFQSWAAQGKAGSCPCGCGWYNGTLINTRARTRKGGRENATKSVSNKLCHNCILKIETKLNIAFKRNYAP